MSETPELKPSWRERLNLFIGNNQFLFLTVIVIFIGALWRYWGMESFKGFSENELVIMRSAKTLASNHWIPNGAQFAQSLYYYKIAAIGVLTNYSPMGQRLLAASLGIVTLIFFFLFVRSWFNKQVALIATLIMATNTTMMILSQVVNPMMLVMAMQMAILYIATLAFRDKNIWFFMLTAVLSVAGMFLSPLFIATGILIFLASIAMVAKNKKIFVLYRFELIALLLPVLLGLAAYCYFGWGELGAILGSFLPGSIATFYLNVGKNILTMFSGSQFISNINVATEPILDPFVAVSAVCGIVFAFFHSGKRKHQFILLWLLFGIVIISLINIQNVANIALILPAIFILSAVMLDNLLTSWVRTFPFNRTARIAMTLLFSIFLFLSVYYNFQKYFYAWQGNPAVQSQYTKTLAQK